MHIRSISFHLFINYLCRCPKVHGPQDTGLLRALHSRNPKNIRNPLIFLQKMASYSCFWRVPILQVLLQASLRRSSKLCPLVSSEIILYAKKVGNKKRPRGIKFPGSYAPCLFCCTFPPASAGRSPIFYTYPSSPGSQSDSAGM